MQGLVAVGGKCPDEQGYEYCEDTTVLAPMHLRKPYERTIHKNGGWMNQNDVEGRFTG